MNSHSSRGALGSARGNLRYPFRGRRHLHALDVRGSALHDGGVHLTRLGPRLGQAGPPRHFRIAPYLGHGSGDRILVRGRVLDSAPPSAAVEGEGTWAAVRRTAARFTANELAGVPLVVRAGSDRVRTVTDSRGYFELELTADLHDSAPWAGVEVELAETYRGISEPHTTGLEVRVPGPRPAFGVVSDIDDTIMLTGAQRALGMVLQTMVGSSLTRTPFEGAARLYRAFAEGAGSAQGNPIFYVSSSPWPLHDFLTSFLAHRGFPLGPLLLRDLRDRGESASHTGRKLAHIGEVLRLHPDLRFVLIGDSGQQDPEIYAEAVRRNPGRILAIYIREVRLDPGDGRVEAITDEWEGDVPFVLASDSAVVARHAAGLGLLSAPDAAAVQRATVHEAEQQA